MGDSARAQMDGRRCELPDLLVFLAELSGIVLGPDRVARYSGRCGVRGKADNA